LKVISEPKNSVVHHRSKTIHAAAPQTIRFLKYYVAPPFICCFRSTIATSSFCIDRQSHRSNSAVHQSPNLFRIKRRDKRKHTNTQNTQTNTVTHDLSQSVQSGVRRLSQRRVAAQRHEPLIAQYRQLCWRRQTYERTKSRI
jgi:hypothetical protein